MQLSSSVSSSVLKTVQNECIVGKRYRTGAFSPPFYMNDRTNTPESEEINVVAVSTRKEVLQVGRSRPVKKNRAESTPDRENRRENLIALAQYLGTYVAIANRIGRPQDASYLSSIAKRFVLKSTGYLRELGGGKARLIEQAFNLPTGWMDQSRSLEDALKDIRSYEMQQAIKGAPSTKPEKEQSSDAASNLDTLAIMAQATIELAYKDLTAKENIGFLDYRENSFKEVPRGSVVVYDKGIKTFKRSGFYVFGIGDRDVLVYVLQEPDGSFIVRSDDENKNRYRDLSSFEIRGFVLVHWIPVIN